MPDSDRVEIFYRRSPDGYLQSQEVDANRWYKGSSYHVLPTKPELRQIGLSSVLAGWTPPEPIIHADTRVFTLGSCFASYFVGWLVDQGFLRDMAAPYSSLLESTFAFENVATIAQQFRWAFDEVEERDLLWIDPNKQLIEVTEEQRQRMRSALMSAEVLIITLGLSEVWYDRVTGEPLWRAVPKRYFDLDRHAFKVLSVAETVEHLEVIDRIRAEHLPQLKIVYTVSPVRLRATFRPVSCLTANSASKAIVRAALDEFLRQHWDQVNDTYFYFPSYEIVTDTFRDPYEHDARHVHASTAAQVLRIFARQYTSLPVDGDELPTDESHMPESDLLARIVDLEARNRELQAACDERLTVISGLDTAARERLELVNQLDERCRALAAELESRRTSSTP